jgi:hypothetical protein
MRHYEFIVEYKTDITTSNYSQKILDKLKIVPQRINSGYKGDADIANDYETVAVRALDQYLPAFSDHADTEYENLTIELYDKHKDEIASEIIKILEDFDPTQNKQYTQYIIRWFLNDNYLAFPKIEDGRSTLKQALQDFYRMKERLPEQYRDIAQYTSAKTFMNSVQRFKNEYGKKEELPKGDFEKVYEDENVTMYWPVDEAAACYLGQGTQWCTSSTSSENYFSQYNTDGPLLVLNWKPGNYQGSKNGQKMQMQIEVRDEDIGHAGYFPKINLARMTQIADAQDNPIGFDDIYSGEDIRFLYPDNLFKETWDKEEFQDAINHTVELWHMASGRRDLKKHSDTDYRY